MQNKIEHHSQTIKASVQINYMHKLQMKIQPSNRYIQNTYHEITYKNIKNRN
jgi:hypothetical protein